jgi:hypothetical protein
MITLRWLTLDVSDNDEGVVTMEAQGATSAAQRAAAEAEAAAILAWAWGAFPHTHGPADDGGEWDHDLQLRDEGGGWHAVVLTLTGTARFADAFARAFRDADD